MSYITPISEQQNVKRQSDNKIKYETHFLQRIPETFFNIYLSLMKPFAKKKQDVDKLIVKSKMFNSIYVRMSNLSVLI